MNYKRLLELILVNLDEGIIVTDASANITFYKEPATNIGGIDPRIAIGKNILDVFPDLTPENSTFYSVIKSKKPIIEHIQHYTNYKGKKVSTVTSTIPIFENGELAGCFEIFKDLTQVMELSEKILRLQEQLYQKQTGEKKFEDEAPYYSFDNIVGKSKIIRDLKSKARQIAGSSSPVLIYGETGTGKELLVQAIHNSNTIRRCKPFIAQNCAALPFNLLESILFGTASGSFTGAKDNPGLFELADGGTLFLDEINSLNTELQAKLLRVLQDGVVRRVGSLKTKRVDVRIITSTNVEPLQLVKQKLLRQDLYFRLNVVYLEIPPLRERKEDMDLLITHFIEKNNEKLNKSIVGISPEVRHALMNYSWPGNVRELEHLIESAMNLAEGNIITMDSLNYNFETRASLVNGQTDRAVSTEEPLDLQKAVGQFEKDLIIKALKASNGNMSQAAKKLMLPKQTLYNKMKHYDIKVVAGIY